MLRTNGWVLTVRRCCLGRVPLMLLVLPPRIVEALLCLLFCHGLMTGVLVLLVRLLRM